MNDGSYEYDLVVRGGQVVNGTGEPAFEGDVGVRGRLIECVGNLKGRGRREIDARGKLITPGFVDIHTHYDGQSVWDKSLAPSSWHGVTTVLMGNCGVGFAPVRFSERESLIKLMEGVEDIPGVCMHEGLPWNWESFSDYLDVLQPRSWDVDVCTQVPHSPIRVYVMGERALRHEKATASDISRMRALTCEAIRAGAFGFSSSRTTGHRSLDGEFTPTLRSHEEELLGIALGMADAGSGQIEVVSDFNQPDIATEFAMLRRIVEKSGRPCVFSLSQRHDRPGHWKELLDLSDAAAREGIIIRPVIAPRPIGTLFGLSSTQNPFSGTESYKKIAALSLEQRVALMKDPAVRRSILTEDPFSGSNFALIDRMRDSMYERMFPIADPPEYEPTKEMSIEAMARREGRSPAEVAYDLLLADGGKNFLFSIFSGYAGFNLEPTAEMLRHKNTLVGLGDGGAHVGFITDASFQTYLLTWWGRDREHGRLPIEDLIRRLTSDTASSIGLNDRGVLRRGMKADINVIDFENLALDKPYAVHDLPAGGTRMLQKARGYLATIVSGVVTQENGRPTGLTPGKLIRGPQSPASA